MTMRTTATALSRLTWPRNGTSLLHIAAKKQAQNGEPMTLVLMALAARSACTFSRRGSACPWRADVTACAIAISGRPRAIPIGIYRTRENTGRRLRIAENARCRGFLYETLIAGRSRRASTTVFFPCRIGQDSGMAKIRDLFDEPEAGATPVKAGSGKSYTAKDIEVLEGLEPVRRRPGMYIGGTDERALHHL